MSRDLNQITKQLGSAHKQKSIAEKELKESRTQFFDAIDEEIIATETLAQQIIRPSQEAPANQDEIDVWIIQRYPGWRFVEEDSAENIIIEEDPAFRKFVYVNHDDGNVYRRNISQAGPSLDDERLKQENPKLWKHITEEREVPATVVRVLKDLETLPDKDLAAMQEYFVPGPITVKLDAPRKAKPDELDI